MNLYNKLLNLKESSKMLELIKKYEGCKLNAYKCPAGIWTIGWGNTTINGRPVKEGDVISQLDADMLLINYYKQEIEPFLNRFKLTEKQRAALASLCYNMGTPIIAKDTDLCNAIKNKDYKAIHLNWTYGYKNNLKGLRIRRTEELFYFMQDS